MLDAQIQIIDKGFFHVRFYKVYDYLLQPKGLTFQELIDEVKADRSLNYNEKWHLENRFKILDEDLNPDLNDILALSENEKLKEEDKDRNMMFEFNEKLNKQQGIEVDQIKNKPIDGTYFS